MMEVERQEKAGERQREREGRVGGGGEVEGEREKKRDRQRQTRRQRDRETGRQTGPTFKRSSVFLPPLPPPPPPPLSLRPFAALPLPHPTPHPTAHTAGCRRVRLTVDLSDEGLLLDGHDVRVPHLQLSAVGVQGPQQLPPVDIT